MRCLTIPNKAHCNNVIQIEVLQLKNSLTLKYSDWWKLENEDEFEGFFRKCNDRKFKNILNKNYFKSITIQLFLILVFST